MGGVACQGGEGRERAKPPPAAVPLEEQGTCTSGSINNGSACVNCAKWFLSMAHNEKSHRARGRGHNGAASPLDKGGSPQLADPAGVPPSSPDLLDLLCASVPESKRASDRSTRLRGSVAHA